MNPEITPAGGPAYRSMPHRLAAMSVAVLTGALSLVGFALTAAPAAAATSAVSQCNGIGPGPKGATIKMTCRVTIVNTISAGKTRSTITMSRSCGLAPCPPGNGTTVRRSTTVVTSVKQCNNSDNDTGQLITCSVSITNNISADTPGTRSTATVNQCVGSATGGGSYGANPALLCSPQPAATTNATITQCNGSATGGGSTAHCTVPGSRVSSALRVRVNQCNGTGNAGGVLLTCSARIVTNIIAASTTRTTTANRTGTTSTTSTTPGTTSQTSRVPRGGVPAGGGSTAGLQHTGLLAIGGLLLLTAATLRVSRKRFCRAT